MAKPSAASLKKVTPENLAGLGMERLAQILAEVAETRTDLKRRLRMELAAGLGAVHLVPEIDKRLGLLETSRGQVTWRQKPAFLRDLDVVRGLISDRLAEQEPDAALERLWRFLATYPHTGRRLRESEAAFEAIYLRGASDLGRLLATHDPQLAAQALVETAAVMPQAWSRWSPQVLAQAPTLAAIALRLAQDRRQATPGWMVVLRHPADGASDVEAYRATFSTAALETPAVAVEVSRRWLAAGQIEAAGQAYGWPRPSKRAYEAGSRPQISNGKALGLTIWKRPATRPAPRPCAGRPSSARWTWGAPRRSLRASTVSMTSKRKARCSSTPPSTPILKRVWRS